MPVPLPIIINALAGDGHGADDIEKLRDLFRRGGLEPRILPAHDAAELRQIAQYAARENPPIIVAGGGDGTINAVASAIVGKNIALGILPLGTLNHFAKDLKIPLSLEEAAGTIMNGVNINVDVGEVNYQFFLNNSSIGLYPHIVRHRQAQQERLSRGKWHAMFWATMTVLRRAPFLRVRLRLDGVEHNYRTLFIFIGNNEYQMKGFSIGQRERLNAGCLSLYVSPRRGRWGMLSLAVRALFGRLHQANDFVAETGHSIRIRTRHKHLLVAIDGEVTAMDSPLDYRVRAGALRVIVPPPETKGS
jgi:diacylglycerol kinase family enzyme